MRVRGFIFPYGRLEEPNPPPQKDKSWANVKDGQICITFDEIQCIKQEVKNKQIKETEVSKNAGN